MKRIVTGMALLALALAAGTAAAQTTPPTPQPPTPSVEDRLSNQERRIGEGLKDGSLTSGEAARLQREESRLNREAARFRKDGVITPEERAKMRRDLNRASRDISRERHDPQRANPNNPINQRMGNQAERISKGIQDGSLTNREAARLEREQARIGAEEKAFRSDGKLGKRERAKLRKGQDRASKHIYKERHDAQTR